MKSCSLRSATPNSPCTVSAVERHSPYGASPLSLLCSLFKWLTDGVASLFIAT